MASLTEISIVSRKSIRYGIYLLIFVLIARFLFNTGKTIYTRLFPPPPPEATVAFGKLPKLFFPIKNADILKREENLSYKLETPDGALPVLTDQLPVYHMPPIPQNINALEDAKNIAQQLGYSTNGKPALESTPNIYIFSKTGVPATFTINIITGIFSVYYDYGQDPSVLRGVPPTPESASEQVISYLAGSGIAATDITQGRVTHQFIRAEGNNLVPADSQSEANLIKVNLFRKNYGLKEDIVSVTPDMPEANVWFLIGSNARQILRGEYHYYPLDKDKSGTYPLKTAEQAWEDLKTNKGYIVNLKEKVGEMATIRRIYLAYYDSGQYQEYYQPVVVFEGDNDFLAYVPAVAEEFYGNEPEN